ncbi:Site-specific recombinase XerD [Saccharopolyspora antimicrobica]|uniref:Site-specific recombinase XerD n=1 Tax=Saccharopolyspora antimicrobica TaxID=455193 RepID=A0A1I4Z5M2_9PSEU|nr:site-specific integrase [Saccharopolyspora antimicrobica]RKT82933.1 site-specific recombinase XerD [Saccharopolyspora antimicrobica]SFN45467.1 Site-specific recombinase XerD [Saccharopolyspora antimicrobica]
MGRPRLELGTAGEIRCYQLAPKKWRARTLYRDYDGVVRPVERVGSSKEGAKAILKKALRDRARAAGGDENEVTASTTVGEAAAIWLKELDESDKAVRTKQTYRDSWTRDLETAVSGLAGLEVKVALATRVLRKIHKDAGPGSAHHAKVVLRGVMGVFVRHDVIESNPIAEVVLPQAGKKAKAAAKRERMKLEKSELAGLRAHLRADKKAVRRDLPELIDGYSALGCRTGELLALDWTKVDFEAGTIAIEGTVIRVKGVGLIVQPHTKSEAGMRTVMPPKWYMDLLKRRHAESTSQWVYPSSTGTLRDPDNTRRQLREAVHKSDWEGLHPYAFRHLVATELDAQGLSAREIADYLGHENPSMTQDVYMNRGLANSATAEALADTEPDD